MSKENFIAESNRIFSSFQIKAEDSAELSGLDSMAITELCVIAEEELGMSITYEDLKKVNTYGDFMKLAERSVD